MFLNIQQPSSSNKKGRGKRGPKKKLEGHFIIEEVSEEGTPLGPPEIVKKLINHIGDRVRDNIPISFWYWKGAEAEQDEAAQHEAEGIHQYVVPDTEKDMLQSEVLAHFSFPDGTKLGDVRTWALQKGAIAFQSFKKRLNKDFVKKGTTPDFTKKGYAKLRAHWDSFVHYKKMEETAKLVAINTVNASKKRIS